MFARSTMMGNARASESGMGKRYGSHAFYYKTIHLLKWGVESAQLE